MKKSIIPVMFALLMFLSYLGIQPLVASASENNCILEASVDVIVEVWNVDDQGNKGYRLWMGLIKQGQQKPITSQHGQIRYAYTTEVDENEPLSGDIDRSCENVNIIGIP